MITTNTYYRRLLFVCLLVTAVNSFGADFNIKNDALGKTVEFGNSKLKITLNYNRKCALTKVEANSKPVISTTAGVISQIKTSAKEYSTLLLSKMPSVIISENVVMVNNIVYGDDSVKINESWKFTIGKNDIKFDIKRNLSKPIFAEESAFPSFTFDNINTFEGAFLGNGGLAWFYLFNEKLCTYGVHTGYSSFWNSKNDNGLKIQASSKGNNTAVKYSRTNADELLFNVSVSEKELLPRYDEDTHRRRFIREKTDVWSGFTIPAGEQSVSLTLTPFSYKTEYYRGNFAGFDGDKVSSVLNTIARIGVIDSKLYGGNSWHTPYGPICLHEQYIAQFALAINDTNYIKGYKECLDYYKDNAIKPDGRVLPRWAYDNSDAMPGTATPLGFYEAQWGYLLDSNPDFVANVAQLYNLSGDLKWARNQKLACEKALDYMLKRDVNKNNLVEMMTDSHTENRGSDWIDIVWASFENAFVNAKMYFALTLWADVEKLLGDSDKANYYSDYAARLKISFNKSTAEGGFWDVQNKWYVYWRDKDNSIHGNNYVVPVNLMAVAYGLCDDNNRRAAILDKLEDQMQKENLFIWPLCLYSYENGEARDRQFPFPKYENGDIFLSWGAVGVQAYASYKPEIAIKYIQNILTRHSQDGLAFQRYGRQKQNGLGDDILSGNCLAVIGLYQSIYGINPLYNRLYLNPHITEKLYNTKLAYNYHGSTLEVLLDEARYSVSDKQFKVTCKNDFGFYAGKNKLSFFNSSNENASMEVAAAGNNKVAIEIIKWQADSRTLKQAAAEGPREIVYRINDIKPGKSYSIYADGKAISKVNKTKAGSLEFKVKSTKKNILIEVKEND